MIRSVIEVNVNETRWYTSSRLVYEMQCEAQFREIENSKINEKVNIVDYITMRTL